MSEDLDFIPDGNFYWYTLRVFNDEDRSVATIKEHISLRKLQNKIVDVKVLKEYVIVESGDYPPDSDDFPKRGFKSTRNSAWVKVAGGNYRRIRLVERKPFGGMVFIKMVHDLDLFKMIRSWDAGFSFLGNNTPFPMSDLQMQKTESSISKKIPDIQEYIKEKNYLLVEGSVSSFKDVHVESSEDSDISEDEFKDIESLNSFEDEISEDELVEAKKAKIYSDLNIKEYEDSFMTHGAKVKGKKTSKGFAVNDFVFIKHLGFKGVIQDINNEAGTVVVGVQMFGRRQPVECKISEISLI